MSRTIAIVSDSGRLINANGLQGEGAGRRFDKFARRLIGTSGSASQKKATIDYGWDGATKLEISKDGIAGDLIELKAAKTSVSGTLSVGGKDLDAIVDNAIAVSFDGIRGTDREIDVTPSVETESGSSSDSDTPTRIYTISLSSEFLDRIDQIERELNQMFPSEIVPGNGLKFEDISADSSSDSSDPETSKLLSVNIGESLRFDGPVGNSKLEVNTSDTPESGSNLPITSGGVHLALLSAPFSPYMTQSYSDQRGYALGEWVTHDNVYWTCKLAYSSGEPWTEEHWERHDDVLNEIRLELNQIRESIATLA